MQEKLTSSCCNGEVTVTEYGRAGIGFTCDSCGHVCEVVRVKAGKAGEKNKDEDTRWNEEMEDKI